MIRITTLVLTLLVFMVSCRHADYYAPPPVEKNIIVLATEQKPLPNNVEIPMYFKGEIEVPAYYKLAYIEVIGNEWYSEKQLVNNMKYEAHKMGANALVNVEFGEQKFNAEPDRRLRDSIYQDREILLNRRVMRKQFMRGLAVVMDSSVLPQQNDSIASHLAYVKQERENRIIAEEKAYKNFWLNTGALAFATVVTILSYNAAK